MPNERFLQAWLETDSVNVDESSYEVNLYVLVSRFGALTPHLDISYNLKHFREQALTIKPSLQR